MGSYKPKALLTLFLFKEAEGAQVISLFFLNGTGYISQFNTKRSQPWWHIPIISELPSLRQEDHKLKSGPGIQ